MFGQYLGQVDIGGRRAGTVWTQLDPDVTYGEAVFNSGGGSAYVGQLRLLKINRRRCEIEILPSRALEAAYRNQTAPVPENYRLSAKLHIDSAGQLNGSFKTEGNKPESGTCQLSPLSPPLAASKPDLQITTWNQCKSWMNKHASHGESMYRGQSRPLPLVSSFHRTGRVNLHRYLNIDLPQFADYVNTYTERRYDLTKLEDRGAIVGLAQHYGFPSPMLDWSRSPYIAASFAFSGVVESAPSPFPVRLFRITPEFIRDFPAKPVLNFDPVLTVEQFRPLALGNTRLLAQQGVMLFSNVPSPESLLRMLESRNGKRYLEVVDVASDLCREALTDLRRMGITAATLFPGLDGIGRALKHELFYNYVTPPASGRGRPVIKRTPSK